jgi:hypothetical protein
VNCLISCDKKLRLDGNEEPLKGSKDETWSFCIFRKITAGQCGEWIRKKTNCRSWETNGISAAGTQDRALREMNCSDSSKYHSEEQTSD